MACDDAVLAASFSPRAYAESLVGLAEKSFLRRGVQLAQAAVSQVQQLKLRLAEILRKDKAQQGSARIGKPAVALMSLIGIVSSYGIAHAPRLVAFSSGDQQIAPAPTIAEHAIANEVDAQLRPVTLRYTVRPSSTPIANVLKAHASANKHGAPRVTKKNELRFLRASVVNSTEMSNVRVDGPSNAPPPALLLSRLPMEIPPAPVLVVFHAQQFGPDGPIFWRVTIVHLTPTQQRAITGGIAKQI